MRIFRLELKRVLKSRLTWILLALALILSVLLAVEQRRDGEDLLFIDTLRQIVGLCDTRYSPPIISRAQTIFCAVPGMAGSSWAFLRCDGIVIVDLLGVDLHDGGGHAGVRVGKRLLDAVEQRRDGEDLLFIDTLRQISPLRSILA